MKTRLLLAAVAAVALAGAASAASATPAVITGLFDTGVDALGNPLADGSLDTHWVLNGTGTPVVYTNPAYLLTSDARFIAAQADGGYVVNPNTYSLTFTLVGLNPSSASLSGFFESDNFATGFLNGPQIVQDVQATVFSNFQSLTPFSAPSADFVSGLNTLSFVVTDTGPPSALLVSGLGGTANTSGTPEPASWALMLLGFGGLGAALRAQRRPATA
jgi:hypothetical protein